MNEEYITEQFALNVKDIRKLRKILATWSDRGFRPTTSCIVPTSDGAVMLVTLESREPVQVEADEEGEDGETVDADVSADSKANGHANPPTELANPEIVTGSPNT